MVCSTPILTKHGMHVARQQLLCGVGVCYEAQGTRGCSSDTHSGAAGSGSSWLWLNLRWSSSPHCTQHHHLISVLYWTHTRVSYYSTFSERWNRTLPHICAQLGDTSSTFSHLRSAHCQGEPFLWSPILMFASQLFLNTGESHLLSLAPPLYQLNYSWVSVLG